MKEKIYTIPVTDAFREECECPMCVLEKNLDAELVDYAMGPSLMEPDGRALTNEKGFCRRHFEVIYNKQVNRLGLGLTIYTHLREQTGKLKKLFGAKKDAFKKDEQISLVKSVSNKLSAKQSDSQKFVDEVIQELTSLEGKCAVCSKLDQTMDRYVDVILFLWFKEEEFKKLFQSKKGFCLKHFRLLLEGTKKYLSAKETALFVPELFKMQLEHLDRIGEEVEWFNKKFDYRFKDEPWKNSKDAIPRSIQKIVGFSDLK
jgi:hypothetical protein